MAEEVLERLDPAAPAVHQKPIQDETHEHGEIDAEKDKAHHRDRNVFNMLNEDATTTEHENHVEGHGDVKVICCVAAPREEPDLSNLVPKNTYTQHLLIGVRGPTPGLHRELINLIN